MTRFFEGCAKVSVLIDKDRYFCVKSLGQDLPGTIANKFGDGVVYKDIWFFQRDYVIFTHGACILSNRWPVNCLENNQPRIHHLPS